MHTENCTDRVVGDILAGWRYDISGIAPEMRHDYEQHLADCGYCRSWQRLHRYIDVALIALSTVSTAVFVLAIEIIHRVPLLHHWDVGFRVWQMPVVLTLQTGAIAGLLISIAAWILVAVATPAPTYLTSVALAQARALQQRIPEELRQRLTRTAA